MKIQRDSQVYSTRHRGNRPRRPERLIDPMACDECGCVVDRRRLPYLLTQTLAAVGGLSAGLYEPAEYATQCDHCGAIESFQPVRRCDECGQWPCDCVKPCEEHEPHAPTGAERNE